MPKDMSQGYSHQDLHGAGFNGGAIASNAGAQVGGGGVRRTSSGISTKPDAPKKTPSPYGGVIQKPEDLGRTDNTPNPDDGLTSDERANKTVSNATNFNNTLLTQMSNPSNPAPNYPPHYTSEMAAKDRYNSGATDTPPPAAPTIGGATPSYTPGNTNQKVTH